MPSLRSLRASTWLVLTVLVVGAAPFAPTPRAQEPAAARERPSDEDVERAMDAVRTDPNLTNTRTVRTLKWRGAEEETPRSSASLAWLVDFFRWLGQSTRVLAWVGLALLAVLLIAFLARMVDQHRRDESPAGSIAPTHVRDLDIRPESLPPDVGAAARALWIDGQRRAALALLYRGLLSRLAHVHEVPIRDSSTEGDCLRLASHLGIAPRDYTARLVPVWQRAVYGGQFADSATVGTLCDDFDAALGSPGGAA